MTDEQDEVEQGQSDEDRPDEPVIEPPPEDVA